MVKVPTPGYQGAQQLGTVQTQRQTSPNVPNFAAGVEAAWRPFIQLAGGVAELGAQMQKQENERNLLEIQNEYQKFERESMLGPDGWAAQQGEQAFGLTDRATADIAAFREKLFESRNLTGAARRAADQWLDGQANSALTKVASHEFGQREGHITAQMEAGLAMAIETAAGYHSNPAELARQTSLVMQRSDALLARQGIDPNSEAGKLASLKASTQLTEAVYYNKLANNPADALAYLNEAEASGMMDANRASVMRAQVTDDAKRYAGKQAGAQLFQASVNATGLAGMSPNSFVTSMFGTGSDDVGPLIMAESSNRTDLVSSAGATGLSQAMPENLETPTSFGYGVVVDVDKYNAGDRQTQWKAGRDYLYALYTHPSSAARGNPVLALMAYNWGIGNVTELLQGKRTWESVPSETIKYVNKLLPGTFAGGQASAAAATPAPAAAPAGETAAAPAEGPGKLDLWGMYQQAFAQNDPTVRDAMLSELSRYAQAHSAAESEYRNQVTDEIYSRLDQGETLDAIFKENPTWRETVGRSVPAMRAYDEQTDQERMGPATDEGRDLYNQMLIDSPAELADMSIADFRDLFKPTLGNEYPAAEEQFWKLKADYRTADAQMKAETAGQVEQAVQGGGALGWSTSQVNDVIKTATQEAWGEKPTKEQVMLTARIRAEIEAAAAAHAAKKQERLSPLDAMRIAQSLMVENIDIDYPGISWDTSTGTVDDLDLLFNRMMDPTVPKSDLETTVVRIPVLDPVTGLPERSGGKAVFQEVDYSVLRPWFDRARQRFPKKTTREIMMLFMETQGNF